ncbi:RCC1 domain-containing protein [Streptomyces gelaticus]|uniref:RCC1 domain-containing protein n=1 Tax=Streptomyces gelaticus TaxID=285446 RepID=UPI00379454BA
MAEKIRSGAARDLLSRWLFAAGYDDFDAVSGILDAAQGIRASDIFAGPLESYAVSPDGKLIGTSHGEALAQAAQGKRIVSVSGIETHVLALTAEGGLLGAGSDSQGAISGILKAAEGRKITAIAAGGYSSFAVTAEGTVLAAGMDDQRGIVTPVLRATSGEKITAIAAGLWHVLALTADGTLLAIGDDPVSCQPVGGMRWAAGGKKITAIAAGGDISLALTADGTLLAAGDDGNGVVSGILNAAKGKKITKISVSRDHALALTADGTLLAAGSDSQHQVSGILKETKDKKITAIAAGSYHSLALAAPANSIDCPALEPGQTCLAFASPAHTSLVIKRGTTSITLNAGTAKGWTATETPQQIVVRAGSRDIAVGSVYFTTPPNGPTGINREASQLPDGLTATADDTNRITFHWTPPKKH